MAYFEAQKAALEAHNKELFETASKLAESLNGFNAVLIRQAAETGQLYGSVTIRDIAGAIKDAVVDIEELALILCTKLRKYYPEALAARYKLGNISQYDDIDDWELLQVIGRKRGFLISGGEINTERTSIILLDEFRAGTIGKITLDRI